jgi:hypothetical protein
MGQKSWPAKEPAEQVISEIAVPPGGGPRAIFRRGEDDVKELRR